LNADGISHDVNIGVSVDRTREQPRQPVKKRRNCMEKRPPKRPPLTPYTFDPVTPRDVHKEEESKPSDEVKPFDTPSGSVSPRLEVPPLYHSRPEDADCIRSYVGSSIQEKVNTSQSAALCPC
jgi:hypothetical protein